MDSVSNCVQYETDRAGYLSSYVVRLIVVCLSAVVLSDVGSILDQGNIRNVLL